MPRKLVIPDERGYKVAKKGAARVGTSSSSVGTSTMRSQSTIPSLIKGSVKGFVLDWNARIGLC